MLPPERRSRCAPPQPTKPERMVLRIVKENPCHDAETNLLFYASFSFFFLLFRIWSSTRNAPCVNRGERAVVGALCRPSSSQKIPTMRRIGHRS